MIQYKRDKKKLFQYINENKEYFKAMDDVIKKHHAGLTDEVIAEFIEKSVEYVRSIIMEEQQIV